MTEEEIKKRRRMYYERYKNKIRVIKAEVRPEIREMLDEIIEKRDITIVDWMTEKVEKDYEKYIK